MVLLAETTDLNTARMYGVGDGSSTAGIVVGGENTSNANVTNVELWNG